MADLEIELTGGHVNHVVRIGDSVRRAVRQDMSVQHALFSHLATKEFNHAPRFLGEDEQGREILTYLHGEVLFDKDDFTDEHLTKAARLFRFYHDCTTDFPPVRAAGAEVMCHNDWTPANTIFVAGAPTGMIDFDTIKPGSRLWDLSYSAWMWLSLGEEQWSPEDQRRRLDLFIAAYDHPSCTASLVAALMPSRQAGRARWAERLGRTVAANWARERLDWTLVNITNHYHPDGLP